MAFGGENAESYYDDGLTARKKGDLAQAVTCFKKAIHLDNSFATAYHQLAKCYMLMGHGQEAVDILHQVMTRKPDLKPARLDYGYALLSVGAAEKARAQFGQLLGLDASDARARLGLANVLFEEGNWAGALTEAQAALQTTGSSFAALFLVGRAARLAGDTELAQETLGQADKLIEKSLELTPEQPEGHYLRGELAFVREQYGTALEHYRAAEDRTDDQVAYTAFGESFTRIDILARQGMCYQQLGRQERAREVGQRIHKIAPDHPLGKALSDLE
jgi:tetratricopeptide (TPR) repeat protein